jgi:hypothetical protein
VELRIGVVDGSHLVQRSLSPIGKSDTHGENSSLVWGSDVFYRLATFHKNVQ